MPTAQSPQEPPSQPSPTPTRDDPGTDKTWREQLAADLAAERYEKAIERYNNSSEAAPADRDWARDQILSRAKTLADSGRSAAAALLLRNFTQINHRDLPALLQLAQVLRDRDEHERAIDVLARAMDAAHNAYGSEEIEQVEQQVSATVEHYTEVLEEREDRQGLVALYESLVHGSFDRPQYRLELARHLAATGQYEDALAALEAIRNLPEWSDRVQRLSLRIQEQRQLSRAGTRVIDLIPYGNHFIAGVRIDGGPKLQLLVDTGASLVALAPKAARQTGLDEKPVQERRPMNTANGTITARIVRSQSLRIGDFVRSGISIALLDRSLGELDGLLGMNAFEGFDVNIDHRQGRLILATD